MHPFEQRTWEPPQITPFASAADVVERHKSKASPEGRERLRAVPVITGFRVAQVEVKRRRA